MKTLSYASLGIWGRLGNQLFEIASTIGMAKRYKAKPVFDKDWDYRNDFNVPDEYFGDIKYDIRVEEDKFHYLPDILSGVTQDHVDILGTLQSEKYFLKIKKDIKKMLRPKGAVYLGDNTVGIHIRRGDYVRHSEYVNYGAEYFLRVINEHFNDEKYTFYICSDAPDYCRLHFKGDKFIIEERSPIDDMKILCGCNHLILCNSTFSWWAAYTSIGSGLVIRPPKIFDGKLAQTHYEGDFWPEEPWIEQSIVTLDLRRTTFIIPVKYDHVHRKENLDIILSYFRKCFHNYEVIIGEQGGTRFKYTENEPGIRYINFSYLNEFHRTHMLNRMTQLATTNIVVNYDCDVLFPPGQIFEMVNMIMDGCGMVYPYSGAFLRIGEGTYGRNQEYIKLLNVPDVGSLPKMDWVGMDDKSVGGAVGYQKLAFIDGGMENENFISYGHEDVERFERFTRLGYNVGRVDGPLYHLNHFCGTDSSTANHYWKAGKEELDKVREVKDLSEYVKSFPWVDDRRIVLLTFSDENYEERQKLLSDMAMQSGQFDMVFPYIKRGILDTVFYKRNKKILDMPRGAGYWLWKPFIIEEAFNRAFLTKNDIILYMDCGDIFYGDLRRFLLQAMKDKDIMLLDGAYKNKDWTKRACFEGMGCNDKKYHDVIQLEAGIIAIRPTKRAKKIVREWLEYCQNEDLLTDNKIENEISTFKEHRHDQSILTNLKVKHNLYSSSELRQFIRCNVPVESYIQQINDQPFDAKDTTFVIPVMYDHKDRLDNLLLCIKYIRKHFNTNIIVGEFYTNKMYVSQDVKYMHFKTLEGFHRTKMINDMVREVTTPIVINMDADVFSPPQSLMEAIESVRHGEYDFAYPHNGSFIKMPRSQYDTINESLNLQDLDEAKLDYSVINSVGGCVVYNKEKFIEAGMENENFISHSKEDRERFRRFSVLGYRIKRVDSPIYHMNHFIGENSRHDNDYQIINRSEHRRTKGLTREEYWKYIKGWDWLKI